MVDIWGNKGTGLLVLLAIILCIVTACILLGRRRITRKKQVPLRAEVYAEKTGGEGSEVKMFGNEEYGDFSDTTPTDVLCGTGNKEQQHSFHIIESIIYIHTDERMN